ncbi:MAG: phosphatase PAP2 family protein [Bacteroidetes bacterium]|jgi:undecaprenyl-diphosphatase|nr:phosphatase PAP2 family protein [Bacteroidota bacterium]MBS1981643.1 phosphatase PAP2 family protein [Bacteroidota bacterium]
MNDLIELDKKILLFFNGLHNPFWDTVMYYATQTFCWLPLYILLILLIFKKYKVNGWLLLLGAALTIALANTITSELMKPYFERLRPTREPSLQGLIHTVNGYIGGLYGFASSHAANTFGTALFLWLWLRPFYKHSYLIFLWAAFMTYTRIYLGVHYPADVLVGAVIGLLSGWAAYQVTYWVIMQRTKKNASSS